MDDGVQDSFGLTSADYIRGVPDSHAVRLRAETASEMILKHAIKLIANSPGDRGYQITSLACGAAGPMFTMVPKLHKNGIRVDKVNLVDWDVMALATAKSLAETAGLEDIVEISRRDLLRQDFRDQLKNSDVVDLLGLFEYFPETIGKGRLRYDLASNFLKIVGREMKPGSAIVFGNMLESRPNQVMFNQMWPKLEQRSIPEILRLIAKAGYPPEAVSVRVAPDGIYAVYSITIPEKGLKLPRDPVMQQISKWALLRFVKEY